MKKALLIIGGIITGGLLWIGWGAWKLYKKDTPLGWPVAGIVAGLILFMGVVFVGEDEQQAQEQTGNDPPAPVVQTDNTNEKDDEEKKAEEYREFGGNLLSRVGFAMDLVGRGFQRWGAGSDMGRGMVEQGLKELNNEVKELDNIDPPKDKMDVHKELVSLVTGYRDIVKQALAAADKGDADTLEKLTKKLGELNKKAEEIAKKVRE